MPKDKNFFLRSVSVVVTAEFHNPSIINPDFLKSKLIVSQDSKVIETITSPALSVAVFEDGIHCTVEQLKLTVTEVCGQSFQDHYRVQTFVLAYLDALPHIPYRSLGLNSMVCKVRTDPEKWITDRFLKGGPWQRGAISTLRMVPKFSVGMGEATCNLSFETGQVKTQSGGSDDAVIVNINMHHEGPLDAEGMRNAIDRWPEKQEFTISAVDILLGK